MKKFIIPLIILAISITTSQADVFTNRAKAEIYENSNTTNIDDEITIFDSDGDPIAYIDTTDDLTIYLWKGKPVAYLESSNNAFNIYGFNGKHLGWLEDGIVRDHDGDGVGFLKGAVNIYTNYEPYKSYKQTKPYKEYKEYEPYKPYYTNQFSTEPLSLFLSKGRK